MDVDEQAPFDEDDDDGDDDFVQSVDSSDIEDAPVARGPRTRIRGQEV